MQKGGLTRRRYQSNMKPQDCQPRRKRGRDGAVKSPCRNYRGGFVYMNGGSLHHFPFPPGHQAAHIVLSVLPLCA